MTMQHDSGVNFAISFASGTPAYLAAFIDPTNVSLLAMFALPCALWAVGQGFVWLRWWIDRRKK